MAIISTKCGSVNATMQLCVNEIESNMDAFVATIDENHTILSVEVLLVGFLKVRKVAGSDKILRYRFTIYEDSSVILTRIANAMDQIATKFAYIAANHTDYATVIGHTLDANIIVEYE